MLTPMLLFPPIVNIIVTGLFAGVILRQYFGRHRLYQLYWAISLCMAFVATVAYVGMLFVHPTSTTGIWLFRIYYILGGALVPAWLGLGSIALVSKPYPARICFGTLSFLSVITAIFILAADINMGNLAQIAGTPGTGTLQPGPWLVLLIILNTLGVVAVVGVAIFSGWKLLRKQASMGGVRTSTILWANLLILTGDLLNAAAGTLARVLGLQSTFWLIMALGWIVLFGGVLLAGKRSRSAKATSAPHAERVTVETSKSQA